MRRFESILSLTLGLGISTGVTVQAQDGAVPLLPPISESTPAPEKPGSNALENKELGASAKPEIKAEGPSDRAPVLALPGMIPRSTRRTSVLKPPNTRLNTPALESPLPLEGPTQDQPPLLDTRTPSTAVPDQARQTLILESVPHDDSALNRTPTPSLETNRPGGAPGSPGSEKSGSVGRGQDRAESLRRQPGLFGRRLVNPFNTGRSNASSSIKVEPGRDPASESALKRRIEDQLKKNFDGKLDQVEVRVVGRDVSIRGRAHRFWQRRGLKRAIESLPILNGLNSNILVD